jgi:large exoprotein involved in heme utilization and adhesion
LNIQAEAIVLSAAENTLAATGFLSRSEGSGNAGSITITTKELEVKAGGQIGASAFGSGHGGNIGITAETVAVDGVNSGGVRSAVVANTIGTAPDSGNSGNISIEAQTLKIENDAAMGTETCGPGHGGDIEVDVANMAMRSGGEIRTESEGEGPAGDVNITASEAISLSQISRNGLPTRIACDAASSGAAGRISLSTPQLTMRDSAMISAGTEGDGAGGNVTIDVDSLSLERGAKIETGTHGGAGRGGALAITAKDRISIAGADTGLYSISLGSGDGGDIEATTTHFSLGDGATVSAKSTGTGDAGEVRINATHKFLSSDSTVNTEAVAADGGDIGINSQHMVHLKNSTVSASVGGGPDTVGGNITIDPDYVILQNSKIIANAYEGRGGNIGITAGCFMADPGSIVDASSALGIDGIVDIRAPVSEVSGRLVPLRQDYLSALALLREPCMARLRGTRYSSFVIEGKDGLPLEPGDLLPSPVY